MASILDVSREQGRRQEIKTEGKPLPSVTVRRECVVQLHQEEVERILRAHFRSLNLPGYPPEDKEESISLEITDTAWEKTNTYVGAALVRYHEVFNHG